MASSKTAATAKSKGKKAAEKVTYTRWLGASQASETTLSRLRDAGCFPLDSDVHGPVLPKEEATRASPPEGHIVVFADQFHAGLTFPAAPIVRLVLDHYGLEISDLNPTAISRLAIFEFAMRSMGMESTATSFAMFHEPVMTTSAIHNGAHSLYGTIGFRGNNRSEALYPVMAVQKKGFNSTMREGNVTHHEYMQVGKGCDVGINQISRFEAEVANGNAEQTLSRDIYRLGRRFDFYRMLSLYFTTVGFYFSSMVTVLTVYIFLYGRLYLVMSGLEKSVLLDPRIHGNIKPLDRALASQAVFQLGLLLVLPMFAEVGLEKGFCIALGEFVILQLQLASVFFTFQLGTKTHFYGRTILHGGAKYRPTGHEFVVHHTKFAEIYRMYSRSHFVKGLELLILLVVYLVYGSSYHSSNLHLFVTFSIWFLVASWLFAPFFFNPSCFEWQKTVDDWLDWRRWMRNRVGIGMHEEESWEAWWIGEQEHLRKTSIRALLLEIILSLRFLIYQYVIVYHLNITRRSRSILVYALSWLVMLTVLVVLKIVSIGRQKFEDLLILGSVPVMVVLFVVCKLTISDVFASILGFLPTGWCILLLIEKLIDPG